jgi:glycosyltransferase involved in cell wall biosynthesis
VHSDRKRMLLWHGYLLSGSGSNVYTASIARWWRAQGHDVLLMCQELRAAEFAFVDASGDFAPDNRSWSASETGAPPARGRCTVARPSIGEVLPVYVLDDYEGFVARRFVDLDDEELGHYTSANVDALTAAIARFDPHGVVVGHEVMGPAIARRAGAAYVAKLHGSALEYAVKAQPRYRAHALEGLCGARIVTGGSRYMIDAAASVVPGWRDRAVVVNPGCDVDLFKPSVRPRRERARVGFVGKLIAAKGPQNLLGALGLTSQGLTLEVVGYGRCERRLRELAGAFARGDRKRARELVSSAAEGSWDELGRLFDSPPDAYWDRAADVEVTFRGRLEHGPLAGLLPAFDVLVVPSVVPEAFGMVAAEAAACGVLPVCPRQSGFGEAAETLEYALGAPGLLTYDPAAPIEGIAGALDRVLALTYEERMELGGAAVRVARMRWSWSEVASRLLELAVPA